MIKIIYENKKDQKVILISKIIFFKKTFLKNIFKNFCEIFLL